MAGGWAGDIDRIYNTLGYFVGNIVRCDSQCNFAKSSHSMEKFTSWIERTYKFQIQYNYSVDIVVSTL